MAFMPQSIQDVQKAVENMIEDLQKTVLMPKQKEAFLCCAKCCDSAGGARDLEACVQRCSQPTAESQKVIQQALGDFQERFQRAAMRCQDEVKDQFGFDPSQSDQMRAQEKFNSCMELSGKEFLSKVPKLKADMLAALRRR
ncbi:hypothetical protein CHLRE_12g551900v5 [Chlamydomonas reinhardtii]|uniref:Uncharacterized protein n=1 Tax=Chlamydomonas reinhardtii TaxID=3055 RepID=A8IYJ5_CHLRE|nr:uncharacterized protein CHLRE_12g551900v5 [Chlamydomonas reinhardtii]PNW75994.1 hypothetical protein CHLRE_12g551900v5 [Chlamydomonas reinhardtii]|eukprot:XP_001694014.1 predicted protein [Chlamydomonas reinhardtii]